MKRVREDFLRRSKLQDLGRWHVTRFVQEVARELPGGATILDAGAGECVYKELFSHCHYKAIDLAVGEENWSYEHLDYVAPLHDIPIEDDSFDAVLCTQVLEHLERPRESVAEMYRVLKPGGRLFLTAPMAGPEHQVPYDFFRYTSFGLRSVCETEGFREVRVIPFGGIWTRWAYELPRCMSFIPGSGLRRGRPDWRGMAFLPLRLGAHLLIRALQVIFLRLEPLDTKKDDPFGWGLTATK